MEETAVLEKSNPLPKFSVADREEPLDLLLYLIKKNEINIYDIPIAQITEQYMEYLDYAAKTDLENLTEFYALAADLLYIKSKMLLPVEVSFDDDEMEDPRQELVDKLIEYQKFKKLSVLMEEKQDESEWTFERKRIQRVLPFDEEELWQKVETWDLLNTFSCTVPMDCLIWRINCFWEIVRFDLTRLFSTSESRCNFSTVQKISGQAPIANLFLIPL